MITIMFSLKIITMTILFFCCGFFNITMIFNLLGKCHSLEQKTIMHWTCTITHSIFGTFKYKYVLSAVRPSLRTTLNNLGCTLLITNLVFGCGTFLLNLLYYTQALEIDYMCSLLFILPLLYRLVFINENCIASGRLLVLCMSKLYVYESIWWFMLEL